MKKQNLIITSLLALSLLVLSGCSLLPGGGSGKVVGATDGGLFKSIDGGTTWKQTVDVSAVKGEIKRFVNEDVRPIILDPQDHEAVFIGTNSVGLLTSFDGATSWSQDKTIKSARVVSVAIDYKDKCKWVVATPTKIHRTLDCGRGWREMLTETREGFAFRVVITDHFNRNVLYAANTSEILKSTDFGETWKTVARYQSEITDLVMDAYDSRILFASFYGGGLVKTVDGGENWTVLTDNFNTFNGARQVRKIVQSLSEKNSYLLATKFGIIKTTDGGTTWTSLPLLTPESSVDIWSIAVHPVNKDVIWYGTDTTLYKTIDGGTTWKTTKLPTTRRPTWLTVDYKDGNVLYLGTRRPE